MIHVERARRILTSTPGVVGYEVFRRHGIRNPDQTVKNLRAAGATITTVRLLGYRLERTAP